jgi:hypothetical protein
MKTLLFKLFASCILILCSNNVFSQIVVVHYNADWNDANKVEWIDKLSDCEVSKVDIVKQPKLQKKHEIVVVPTIIIFKDNEEVKRFQADISFSMKATREEVQGIIDEQNLSDF